ncbi:MAG: hypothetical protein ABIA97_07045 [Candidatus Omnitrophota bacterium]
MRQIASAALVAGMISLVIGILLRLIVKEMALGLVPSSFLEFSVVCFLLSIAINTAK